MLGNFAREDRDWQMVRSFSEAVGLLDGRFGADVANWQWGRLHTVRFSSPLAVVPPLDRLFNRGPFQVAGGSSIVNATGWDASESFDVATLPSMRFIADLSNLGDSLTVHTTGESGHAGNPHYIDMADLWRNIQYYPMLWDEQAVTAGAEGHLKLLPYGRLRKSLGNTNGLESALSSPLSSIGPIPGLIPRCAREARPAASSHAAT